MNISLLSNESMEYIAKLRKYLNEDNTSISNEEMVNDALKWMYMALVSHQRKVIGLNNPKYEIKMEDIYDS